MIKRYTLMVKYTDGDTEKTEIHSGLNRETMHKHIDYYTANYVKVKFEVGCIER